MSVHTGYQCVWCGSDIAEGELVNAPSGTYFHLGCTPGDTPELDRLREDLREANHVRRNYEVKIASIMGKRYVPQDSQERFKAVSEWLDELAKRPMP